MPNFPKVAIVYLSYHCELYLERAIEAWKKLDYPKEQVVIVVVDNQHKNYGSSAKFIQEKALPLSGNVLPKVVFLPQETNLGFAGGNNIGINWAVQNGYDYVFLHNQDGFMAPECLAKLVEAMEKDKTVGAAQALICLFPEIDLVNTSGNKYHYLGFGFCGDYRLPVIGVEKNAHAIGYASGAALLMRVDLIRAHGMLDADFFAYHEDFEYSFRLKAQGYKIILAPEAHFFHEYEFDKKNTTKYFLMERNRIGMWLMYLDWSTLLLLAPIEILLNFGLLFFSLKCGWIKEWAMVQVYWLKWSNWRFWLNKRVLTRKSRKLSDRDLLQDAVSAIEFEGMGGRFVRFGNYVLTQYARLLKALGFK
ncbi:MAG: glycosyltransferase family 2 protein [Candidatus Magasanikbacteria bacterium]|jgi:hypothetical protein